MHSAIAAIACAALVAGCAGDSIKTRAANDLHCDESQISVTPVTDNARKVEGCGQRALYVQKCKPCGKDGAPNCDCAWEMNTNPGAMP